MKLRRFAEIDTCPICGHEIYFKDNPYVGEPDIRKIPQATVFEIPCLDEKTGGLMCGFFRIQRRRPVIELDDWVAEYLLNEAPHPLDDPTPVQ